jgi:hypothetical protein
VTDTAIKIGLGALIAGAFAVFSSRRQYGNELEREHMKRREPVLDKVAEELELAYQGLSAKYERALARSFVTRDTVRMRKMSFAVLKISPDST